MYFPKYWAKGHWEGVSSPGGSVSRWAWGWSDLSVDDAERLGRERAARAATLPGRGARSPGPDEYPYPNGPLREPIEHILGPDDSVLITRNASGCEVMNTAQIVFVDVDLPPPAPVGFFARLLGRSTTSARAHGESKKIELLARFQQNAPALGFRVYRTAGGLRYLLTSGPLAPDDPTVDRLFQFVSCDESYRRLCKVQHSFRARLTPKPHRIGCPPPPHRVPFCSDDERREMDDWLGRYTSSHSAFATCELATSLGNSSCPPEIAAVVEAHDAATGAHSGRPLA